MLEDKIYVGSGEQKYRDLLDRLGTKYSSHFPWIIIGQTDRIQGWKIHLSSIPIESPKLLSSVVPFMMGQNVSFKFAQDEIALTLLNEGSFGATQVGKFLTIYPNSDLHARNLAERLVNITKGFHGPIVTTDLQIGNIVFVRYGGFNPIVKYDRLGESSLSMTSMES